MNKEIEIKILITDALLTSLREWLNINATFVKKIHHIEYYLNNPKIPFCFDRNGLKDADNYLRVRLTDKGDSVCLKKFFLDPTNIGRHTHCDEYETKVEDGKLMLELFTQIGFTDQIVIDKVREEFIYADFEIVIDNVKGLGYFVEVELKKEMESTKEGHKVIKEFLKLTGITTFKEQFRGYVSMKWNPQIDYGEEKTI